MPAKKTEAKKQNYNKIYWITDNSEEDFEKIKSKFEEVAGIKSVSKFTMDGDDPKTFINICLKVELTEQDFNKFSISINKYLNKDIKVFYKSIDGVSYIYTPETAKINKKSMKQSLMTFIDDN